MSRAGRLARSWMFSNSGAQICRKQTENLLLLESFEDGPGNQGESYGCVVEYFSELAAFGRGNELAPGDRFAVGRTAETAPMNGLGADAESVMVAL